MTEPGCRVCGQGPHRYGTTDTEHKYDSMGCVNMLLPLVEELRAENESLRADLARARNLCARPAGVCLEVSE